MHILIRVSKSQTYRKYSFDHLGRYENVMLGPCPVLFLFPILSRAKYSEYFIGKQMFLLHQIKDTHLF